MWYPASLTSTPNWVPRSVTVAVGVRTPKDEGVKDGRGTEKDRVRSCVLGSLALLLSFEVKLPSDGTPPLSIRFVPNRAVQNDLGPRVVRDLQRSQGKGEAVAEADKGFLI